MTFGFDDQFSGCHRTVDTTALFDLDTVDIDLSLHMPLHDQVIGTDFPFYLAVLADSDDVLRVDRPFEMAVYIEIAVELQFALESSTFCDDGGIVACLSG